MEDDIVVYRSFSTDNANGDFSINIEKSTNDLYYVLIDGEKLGEFETVYDAADATVEYLQTLIENINSAVEELQDNLD